MGKYADDSMGKTARKKPSGGEDKEYSTAEAVLLSATLDDMSAEHLSFLTDMLFEAGAGDVWQENVLMKKNRAGVKVCALCSPRDADALVECFFVHSTTLGVRRSRMECSYLRRSVEEFESSFGAVRIKVARFRGCLKAKPEFEDCRAISIKTGLPIGAVSERIKVEYSAGWRESQKNGAKRGHLRD